MIFVIIFNVDQNYFGLFHATLTFGGDQIDKPMA